MKKALAAALVLLTASTLAVSSSAGYSESMDAEYIYIREAEDTPKIDGIISANEYSDATYVFTGEGAADPTLKNNTAGWYYNNGKKPDANYVNLDTCFMKVYTSWDSENLYVALDTNFAGYQQKKPAATMWQDYCVQLQLGDKDLGTYDDWGMAINEDGEILQYSFTNSRETDFTVKITRDGDHIVYECALPWSEFVFSGVMKTGTKIGLTCGVTLGQNGNPFTTFNFGQSSTVSSYHDKNYEHLKLCYLVPSDGEYTIPVETEAPATEKVTDKVTDKVTTPATKPVTNPVTTPTQTNGETNAPVAQNNNTGLIIEIVAAVVVVGAVVAVIVIKKKKQ